MNFKTNKTYLKYNLIKNYIYKILIKYLKIDFLLNTCFLI